MPQPLSRVQPDANVFLANAGQRVLRQRPQLAVNAIEAIASSANVEAFLLKLFVSLMGGNKGTAARIYLALEIQSAKSVAITEAVKCLSNADHQRLVIALVQLAKRNQKRRDRIAHYVWGISPHPKLQDALLLADPKSLVNDNIDMEHIFVYRETDFLTLITDNDRLCGYWHKLRWIIEGHVANKDGRLYDELCREPEVREILNRLAAQDQRTP